MLRAPNSWLNDAVKSYLSPRGEYDPYLELEHLRVFVAQPAYLLAMKCVAMRLGEELNPRMTLKLPRMTLKLWDADPPPGSPMSGPRSALFFAA